MQGESLGSGIEMLEIPKRHFLKRCIMGRFYYAL